MGKEEQLGEPREQFNDVAGRNQWLEQALNGNNDIPEAAVILRDGAMQTCAPTLPEDLPFISNAGSIYTRVDDESMGSIVFGIDEKLPNKLIVIDSGVLKQGAGHGRRLYLEALKALPLGYGLASHSMLSADAVSVWEWLIGSGVATRVDREAEGQIGIYETIF